MPYAKYLIIGGSAAGMSAAEIIRKNDPEGTVCVISEEPDTPYFRPMIPFVISGAKKESHIALPGNGPFTGQDVKLRLNTKAQALDPVNKQIQTSTGENIGYDRLLIATGSRPHVPEDIEGCDTKGVYSLRTIEDARRMAAQTSQTQHAVMLGGGLLNLKAAFALLERNIRVSMVVFSPEVLSQLMDPEDALLIRQALDDAGLQIITGMNARKIIGDQHGVKSVLLDSGEEIDCQLVCIGKGVKPNIEWLEASGVELKKGVVVDKFTQTNIADIYAAGDVAVTFDPVSGDPVITGLWTNAVEMGRCAGANMTNKRTLYGGTFGVMNATQIAGVPFVSMGLVHTKNSDCRVECASSPAGYRKMVFSPDGTQLVGIIFIGEISKSGLYRTLIREKINVTNLIPHLMDQSLHYGDMLFSRR